MAVDATQWPDLVARANLKAMVRELGANLMFMRQEGDELVLALPADLEDLRTPVTVSQLAAQLAPVLGFAPRLRIDITREAAGDTLHARNARGLPADPVARFHLGNGARLEQLHFLGDDSDNGIRQANGVMVNYLYDLAHIEKNHEAFAENRTVVASSAVKKLVRSAPVELVPLPAG